VARQRSSVRAALIKDLTIDNGVLNSFRPHDESASAAGQIVDRLPSAAGDPIVVKNRNVSREPGSQPSAVADLKKSPPVPRSFA